ncbi:hypothetical protein [Sphingobacterium multivorum]|uniref:hypothetical protein n=1 Tax=Sphingobacterium multivorum TaxID=28454 RepID=UPI003DA504C1
MNLKSFFLTAVVSGILLSECHAQTNIFPATGNVGIGMTNPVYQIDVRKAAENNLWEKIVQYTVSDAPNESLTIANGTAINGRFIPCIQASRTYADDFALGMAASVPETSDIGTMPMVRFDARRSAGPLVNRPLFSWGSYESNYMTMNAKGNLGIGTDNPQQKLSVKGKIQAEEIKVTTTATEWPDYVFEGDYQLSSLQQLETFVKSNKHLPDMPTAKEVEQNGIQLGEMIKTLLKNNEELTLHVISLQKQIDELKTGNK